MEILQDANNKKIDAYTCKIIDIGKKSLFQLFGLISIASGVMWLGGALGMCLCGDETGEMDGETDNVNENNMLWQSTKKFVSQLQSRANPEEEFEEDENFDEDETEEIDERDEDEEDIEEDSPPVRTSPHMSATHMSSSHVIDAPPTPSVPLTQTIVVGPICAYFTSKFLKHNVNSDSRSAASRLQSLTLVCMSGLSDLHILTGGTPMPSLEAIDDENI
eukprot:GHVR01059330.1.p1 GENE.GHVR01059330.1~~GHVR01059330.1.p1  ORF type:complete len:219 (-),score=62.40 GHVR01059330.1:116-772(-)